MGVFQLTLLGVATAVALRLAVRRRGWHRRLRHLWEADACVDPAMLPDPENRLIHAALHRIYQRSALLLAVVCLEEDRLVHANTTFLERTGWSLKDLTAGPTAKLPVFPQPLDELLLDFLGQDRYPAACPATLSTRSGETLSCLFSGECLAMDGHHYLLASWHDITVQEQAQAALRASETRYRTLFHSAPDAIVLLHEGHIVEANEAAVELFGGCRESLWDKTPMDFTPPHQLGGARSSSLWRRHLAQGTDGERPRFEWRFQRLDGTILDAEVCMDRLVLPGEPELLLLWIRDITQEKSRRSELSRQQERLRSLAHTLSVTEEAVRRRVATFLHDQICQGLVSCRLMLDALRSRLAPEERTLLERAGRSLAQLAEQTQGLTVDLASPTLDRLGLAAAVQEWLGEHVEGRHGIVTYFECDGDLSDVDPQTAAFVFRTIKELGYNVIKHARAANLWVTLEADFQELRIRVADDGTGFDVATMRSSNELGTGLGLLSIRERLDYLGGRFHIESQAGSGTVVDCRLPVRRALTCSA